jgi:acetyltransferase
VKAVEIAGNDPNGDGLLVILAPQRVTDPTVVAEKLKAFSNFHGKPLLASWMGGAGVAAGESILNRAGIPTYSYPDSAAQVFHAMWRYSDALRALYETPAVVDAGLDEDGRAKAAAIIAEVRASGRALLTEAESKNLLAAYGIPVVETAIASTADEAAFHAEQIGYPVVVKLHSRTVSHKTEVHGVHLNLTDASSVRKAFRHVQSALAPEDFLGVTVQPMIATGGYELILGSSIDAQFGPVLLFGSGGRLVEVYRDRALGLPPLNTTLARRMMERTKIFSALGGVRGRKPADIAALERLLVRFSYLVAEQRRIKEIDINPLLVSADQIVALDARVVLHPPETIEKDLPRLAIRPYPVQYVKPWRFEDGTEVVIRPIRPEDEPLMVRFHERLSERSVYLRYFHLLNLDNRIAHERLTRICFIDYDREMALVVERANPESGEREILAVGRLTKAHHLNEGEFALLIADGFQGHGIGTQLLRQLVEIGRAEGLDRIVAEMLPENDHMIRIARQIGFEVRHSVIDRIVKARLELTASPA